MKSILGSHSIERVIFSIYSFIYSYRVVTEQSLGSIVGFGNLLLTQKHVKSENVHRPIGSIQLILVREIASHLLIQNHP